jgi:uncharacterized membrane protein YbhN (UPF0104 family)
VPGLVFVLAVGALASLNLDYAGPVRLIAGSFAVAGTLGALATLWFTRKRDITTATKMTAGLRGLLFWCVVALSQVCFMLAAGVRVPFGYAVAVVAVVNALSLIPVSLGGYGLREGAFGTFLAASGQATLAQGAVVGACLSLQTFAFGLIGGVVYLTSGRPSPNSLRTAESVS